MEKRAKSIDVCIVCALYQEAQAVLNEFSTRCTVSFIKEFSGMDRYEYRRTSILNNRGEPLTVLVTWLSDSGPTQAGLDLKPFLHEFRPRFVAMTGFCAGYKKEVKWGDLVVAQYAYFYEAGKIISEPEGLTRQLQEMKAAASTSQVLQYAKGFDGWKEPVKKMKCDRLKRELKDTEEPLCVIAPMASGMAVRQDDPLPWLREHYDRNTVGLDMEAATFYQALRAVPQIHALVVKGVCDYANMSKKDTYRDYAARASAIYLLSFIQEYVTEQTMPLRDAPPSSSRDGPSILMNIPQMPNPYFTGRETLLEHLHEMLMENIVTLTYVPIPGAPRAISGLGGIGKTQTAIEYAYRYSRDYEAVLWIKADSRESIRSGFRNIAKLLNLPEKDVKESRLIVAAVKVWLEDHTKWLLIFDNADDLEVVQDFLPRTSGRGRNVLLTTRANAVEDIGATLVEINTWNNQEGVRFLLLRTGIRQTTDDDRRCAKEIVQQMGGLPLALEQAGAYIGRTRISIREYLELYRKHQDYLLKQQKEKRRKPLPFDYPYTVATVWSLSFEKLNQTNPAAIQLLYLCAFLDPDAIPEEIIAGGTRVLGSVLGPISSEQTRMNEIIKELLRFSLIRRNSNTLIIHRLVQFVIQNNMDEEMRSMWAERAIRTVHQAFPNKVFDVKTWSQCQLCLPHALACAKLIDQYELASPEAARLLNQVGYYLREQARYAEAEPFFKQALAVREQVLGPKHPDTAESLNNLARLYLDQYEYAKAEPFYEQARQIREEILEQADIETARAFNSLAVNYWYEEKFAEAESLYRRALPISEQKLGPEDALTLHILNNMALLYRSQGKYEEAIKLNQQVLITRERKFGPVHLEVAQSLQNLAITYYYEQGNQEQSDRSKYEQAEDLLKRALAIREKLLPEKHLQIARCLRYLALVYEVQDKDEKAEECFKRATEIREELLGADHSQTIETKEKYAALLRKMKRDEEAAILEAQLQAIQDSKSSQD